MNIYTINLPINLLVENQDLANPYTRPNVGPAPSHQQGTPEHVQVMFRVSVNIYSLNMFSIEFIAAG